MRCGAGGFGRDVCGVAGWGCRAGSVGPPTPTPQPGASPTPPGASPAEPPGYGTPGYVAYWIKKYWRPQAHWANVEKWAATHRHYAHRLDDMAEASRHTYVPLFHQLLQGQSGDTLQKALAYNMNLWLYDAAEHQSAATALDAAATYLRGLEADLTEIKDHYEPQWDTAVKDRDIPAQAAIVVKLSQEVPAAVKHAEDGISVALNGKFGTNPLQQPPPVVV